VKRDGLISRIVCLLVLIVLAPSWLLAADPLPSWNDGIVKQSIIALVEKVTKQGGADYVRPAERIAVFDNDGTLWAEQPYYFPRAFVYDRVLALAPKHPEWKDTLPYKAVLEGKYDAVGKGGLSDLVLATHTGMTTDEFTAIVREWFATARHPIYKRSYADFVYQPMLELLEYFRANGFKTFIVTAGNDDLVRVFSEKLYGIPPEQVIGSNYKLKYEIRDGKPVLVRLPEVDLSNSGPGKAIGVHQQIGIRPIAAFGNSDGDFEMLEWTTAGSGARLGAFIHHDDAEREWSYDRKSSVGKLARGLDEVSNRGWMLVSMKKDWKRIYPVEMTKPSQEAADVKK